MAIYKNSPYGVIKGQIGDVIGQNYEGMKVIRNSPANYNDRNSTKQREHRQKLKNCTDFMKLYREILELGMSDRYFKIRWNSLFVKLNVTNSFLNDLNRELDRVFVPESLLIAKGRLTKPYRSITITTDTIRLTKIDSTPVSEIDSPDDMLNILVISGLSNDFFIMKNVTTRGTYTYTINGDFERYYSEAFVYLFYNSTNYTMISNQQYKYFKA